MSELEQRLKELIAPWERIPGVAVCVVAGEAAPVVACAGYASLEYGLPITPQTRFNIASVSKQFTAFAIRLLEKRGRLSLDDPIHTFLPDLPEAFHEVQVHHLLHHTSGFRDMYNLQAYSGFRRDDVHTREQLLALTRRLAGLNFRPGDRFVYNNTGYVLAAEIVARLTGMDLRHFLEAELFRPLGMEHTLVCDNHKELIAGFAGHYNLLETGAYAKAFENVSVSGSTNIITTITDFARWLGNYTAPRVAPEVMLGLNHTRPFNDGRPCAYGCGLELSERAGKKLWTHGGGAGGFRSELIFVPEARVAVGVLSNNGSMDAVTLGNRVLGLVLPELAPKPEAGAGLTSAAFSEKEGKDLPGCYQMPDGLLATVEASEDRFYIQTPFYPTRLPLVKLDDRRYRIDLLNANIEAEYDAAGKVCAFNSTSPIGTLRAVKLPPVEVDEAALDQYTGRYFSAALLNLWEVSRSGGRLTLFHPHFPVIRLFPVLQDEFSSDTENFDRLKFVRNAAGQVMALELSGDRAFNIRFEKVKEISYVD